MDGTVLTEYIHKYGNTVYRVAYNLVNNSADCEDIAQEVFIKLYQADKEFDSDEHIKAWLIRVAINKAKDHLRSTWQQRTEELSDNLAVSDNVCYELAAAMECLDKKYRIVVYLHYYEGYCVKEIAKMLGISEANVKTRLKRAREKLKAYLVDDI